MIFTKYDLNTLRGEEIPRPVIEIIIDEPAIIKAYQRRDSLNSISRKHNISIGRVKKILTENNVPPLPILTKFERFDGAKFISQYRAGENLHDLIKLHKTSLRTAKELLLGNNVAIRTSHETVALQRRKNEYTTKRG